MKIISPFFLKLVIVFAMLLGIAFLVALCNRASAQSFSFSPNSASMTVGQSQNVNVIINNPPTGTNVVALRISVPAGFQIQSFSLAPNFTTNIPCAGSAMFTAQLVCVDAGLGSSATLANGDLVGTMNVKAVSAGSGTLSFTSGNAMSTPSQEYAFVGASGTFASTAGGGGGGGGTTLPNTASGSRGQQLIPVVIGLVLILLGGSLYKSSKYRFSQNK